MLVDSCSAARRRGNPLANVNVSQTMPRAAQRMPPVDAARFHGHRTHVVQVPVFLPQFVGEKKCDDQQRNDQKDAQYQVLDHGGLRLQEHDFIVEHRAYPYRAARLTIATIEPNTGLRQRDALYSPDPPAAWFIARKRRAGARACKNSPHRALTNWKAREPAANARIQTNNSQGESNDDRT
ncbi:hypothetical protein B0G74_4006 [Paraburkholderia sp. BL9I2N2]|nr:hypothetical protein B0G74_4006 [Paraburkholderia sp. BL9I2N2]